MKEKDSFRGNNIDQKFAEDFKNSKFYTEIYKKHRDELIIAVRDGYINLYHNCNSIAKIDVGSPQKAHINTYYYTGKSGKYMSLTDDELASNYKKIIFNSDHRQKLEKQAQEQLVIANNNNKNSEWYCIDVEYTKSLKGKLKAEDWRFDIIAITKTSPHRVALIELKYGYSALQGKSGIRKHIKDFYSFYKDEKFSMIMPEIVSIINGLVLCVDDNDIPQSLKKISCENIHPNPEFYFITLNDKEGKAKQIMSGQLFKDKRWGCKRISSLVNKEDYFAMIHSDKDFNPTFLFSKKTLPNINILDILDAQYYDDVETDIGLTI